MFTHRYLAQIFNPLKHIYLCDIGPPQVVVFGGGGWGIECFFVVLDGPRRNILSPYKPSSRYSHGFESRDHNSDCASLE